MRTALKRSFRLAWLWRSLDNISAELALSNRGVGRSLGRLAATGLAGGFLSVWPLEKNENGLLNLPGIPLAIFPAFSEKDGDGEAIEVDWREAVLEA